MRAGNFPCALDRFPSKALSTWKTSHGGTGTWKLSSARIILPSPLLAANKTASGSQRDSARWQVWFQSFHRDGRGVSVGVHKKPWLWQNNEFQAQWACSFIACCFCLRKGTDGSGGQAMQGVAKVFGARTCPPPSPLSQLLWALPNAPPSCIPLSPWKSTWSAGGPLRRLSEH